MDPIPREAAQRRGQRKLDAMKRRTGQLRRRVVAAAVIGFVVLWMVVFVQMATGNDPALGTGPMARKRVAIDHKQRQLEASVSPPAEEAQEAPNTAEVEVGEGAGLEAEAAETERIEAERAEAEQIEIQQREAEARELEELEAVTTGQS